MTRRRLPLVLAGLLTLTACSTGAGEGDGPVVVYAASSTAPAIEQAAAATSVEVALTAAGSQVLAAQLRGGAPADVVLLADIELAAALFELGLSRPERLLTSGLSLVGRPGLTATTARAALDDPDLLVVLADEGVPLGDATTAALELEGIELDPARVVSLEDSAASVLAKIAAGEADLAVVYTANARSAVADGRAVDLGELAAGEVVVTMWVQFATSRGEAFVTSLRSAAGVAALRDAGFEVEAPAG